MEQDEENLNEEYDKLLRELHSVNTSLDRLRAQNKHSKRQIDETGVTVDAQQVQIRTTQAEIETIGVHVSLAK